MVFFLRKLSVLSLCYLLDASTAEMTERFGNDRTFPKRLTAEEAIFETVELRANSSNESFTQRCMETCDSNPSCLGFSILEKESKVLCHLLNKEFMGFETVNKGLSLLSSDRIDNASLELPTATACVLEVRNEYPYNTPRDAPYYGSHADWLEVRKEGNKNNNECAAYKKKNPNWCKYLNSNTSGDSAQIEKVEDKYFDDPSKVEILNSETITVEHAAEKRTVIDSYHYFFDNDYYPDFEEWNDHMLAPEVKIFNLSNNRQEQVGQTRKHPTKKSVSTHVKNTVGGWEVNENYEGNMKIVISCSASCWCVEDSFETSTGDMYYKTNDGGIVSEPNGSAHLRGRLEKSP